MKTQKINSSLKPKKAKKTLIALIKEVHAKNKWKKTEEIEDAIDEAVKWDRRKTKRGAL